MVLGGLRTLDRSIGGRRIANWFGGVLPGGGDRGGTGRAPRNLIGGRGALIAAHTLHGAPTPHHHGPHGAPHHSVGVHHAPRAPHSTHLVGTHSIHGVHSIHMAHPVHRSHGAHSTGAHGSIGSHVHGSAGSHRAHRSHGTHHGRVGTARLLLDSTLEKFILHPLPLHLSHLGTHDHGTVGTHHPHWPTHHAIWTHSTTRHHGTHSRTHTGSHIGTRTHRAGSHGTETHRIGTHTHGG